VPKQISTGDRTILGKISEARQSLPARSVRAAAWLAGPWIRTGKSLAQSWIEAAKRRLHHNLLAIWLANKLARSAWGGAG